MLQVSKQMCRPSGSKHLLALSLLRPGANHKALLGTSCTASSQAAKISFCSWRILICVQSGLVQERPSAVPWSVREAHTGTAGKSHGRRKKILQQSSLQYAKRGSELEARDVESATEESEEKDSKGQSKRKALRAKEWGNQLASLSPAQLRQAIKWASLSEDVYDAVMLVKSLGAKVRNGKRRQYNYIGGLLRETDPDLMEQVLKVCIDGDSSGSAFVLDSATELSEDDIITDDEMEIVSEEDLSSQNTAQRWLEGLLRGDDIATCEVFSSSSDVYFDRQDLRRLLRTANQTHDAASSLELPDIEGDENPPASLKDSLKATKKAEISLFNFLKDLARRRLQESESLDA